MTKEKHIDEPLKIMVCTVLNIVNCLSTVLSPVQTSDVLKKILMRIDFLPVPDDIPIFLYS